jgi:hypothetical protein
VSTKPKQIVVDKDAFIGIGIDALCDFAADHLLLCCDTLLYECATTSEASPKEMLYRYKRLIQGGAYYCSCSVTYLQSEGKFCSAYPWFLPDLDATQQIRTGKARLEDTLNSPKTGDVFRSRCKVARAEFVGLSAKLKSRIDLERPDVGKVIRDLPRDRFARLGKLFERIDTLDLHQMGVESVPENWIKDKTKFCLSSEWMSWHYVRLTSGIVGNYYYLRQMGGVPGDVRAEHDYQDMEYVLLLSRADALLTRDNELVSPLAKAAFPEKDVFSDLNEVPEEYVGYWS